MARMQKVSKAEQSPSPRWAAAAQRVRSKAGDHAVMLAMDLDFTLFPNPSAKEDPSLPRLVQAIREYKMIDVWASGRRRNSACARAAELGIPLPEFFLSELGTVLLRRNQRGDLVSEPLWQKEFEGKLKDWDRERIKTRMDTCPHLEYQRRKGASPFKLGYCFEPEHRSEAVRAATELAREASRDALVICSIDVVRNVGFVDVVPFCADKKSGIAWLKTQLSIPRSQVVYAGDSGNDVAALTAGWLGIVVKNALPDVKGRVTTLMRSEGTEERVYHAQGMGDLSGNFSSGILEGLIAHRIIDERFAELTMPPPLGTSSRSLAGGK